MSAKIFERRDSGSVDVKLDTAETTKDVFWSPRWVRPLSEWMKARGYQEGDNGRGGYNSYVLLRAPEDAEPSRCFIHPDGTRVWLMSVNGMGEIRWFNEPSRLRKLHEMPVEEFRRIAQEPWEHDSDGIESMLAVLHFGLRFPPVAEHH